MKAPADIWLPEIQVIQSQEKQTQRRIEETAIVLRYASVKGTENSDNHREIGNRVDGHHGTELCRFSS